MDFTALASSLGTSATGAISAAVPVILIVLGATVGYRLFKRFVK